MSLSVSDLVNVEINLSPLAAAARSFGVLMIAGDSNVISAAQRFRTYTNITGVAADFGTSAPEYQAAALYFAQLPKPSTCMIGRWLRTASAAQNVGGILTASQQILSNFTSITNGGMIISIDGSVKTLTGLNFSGATNLNGVASVITTALSSSGTCTWDGTEFNITSATTGAGTAATGSVTFTTNAAAADTLTLNGTAITFVASSPTGSQVLIGADATTTAANLQAFLNVSVDANILTANYSTAAGVTTITYKTLGTAGNSYSIAKSSTHLTLSGATLTGGAVASSVGYATTGTGTDVSTLFKLTSSTSQALIAGANAETPVECANVLATNSAAWYGLMFQASVQPTDQQSLDVSTFIEAQDLSRIFGVTITDPNILSSIVTSDLASLMKGAGYNQSFCQYSSTNNYSVASYFGRAFSVDFTANNTTITMMFKQEPGVTAETITEQQALTLKNKRCNVFVNYVNNTALIQFGVLSGSAYFDEIQGLDWFQNSVQTNCFNVLYQSTTKVPQTDAGVNQLTNAISSSCQQAVSNGLSAPGVWNAPGFGELVQGQYLKSGYYIYAQPISLQSQADRETRVSPPIQVAIKLAGAIQSLNVLVNVNR